MDAERFDTWARGLRCHLGRRRLPGLVFAVGMLLTDLPGSAAKRHKKKKKKGGCPSGEFACPQGSKDACCPTIFPACCPDIFSNTAAVCCSIACCASLSDCPAGTSCENGCCLDL